MRLERFKPYPSYKDSGVEWLGGIPVHWEVKRIKRSRNSHQPVQVRTARRRPDPGAIADCSSWLPASDGADRRRWRPCLRIFLTKHGDLIRSPTGYPRIPSRVGDVTVVAKITPCFMKTEKSGLCQGASQRRWLRHNRIAPSSDHLVGIGVHFPLFLRPRNPQRSGHLL